MKRALVLLVVLIALGALAFVGMREGMVPTPEFMADTVGRRGGETPAPLEIAGDDEDDDDESMGELRAAPMIARFPREAGSASAPGIDVVKPTGSAITGVVLGEGGRPIANARVQVSVGGQTSADGTTDADGRVKLDVAVGHYDVKITAGRDGVLELLDVVVDGRGFDGKFQLTPAATLEVTITTDGRGVFGVPVVVRATDDGSTRVLASGATDGRGSAKFPDLVASNVVVEALDAQGLVLRKKASLQGGAQASVELVYPPMVVWSGVVREASTMAGVLARIELDVDGADGLRFTKVGASDLSGSFSFSVPKGKPSRLAVSSSEHATYPGAKEMGAALGAIAGLRNGSLVHDLLVRRGATVTGVAKGPDGHGVSDLTLRFRLDRGAETVVLTDATGRYTMGSLSSGMYSAAVATPNWYLKAGMVRFSVPAESAEGPASVTLDLDVWSSGVVSGSVVLADGSPAIGARVWLVGGRGVVRGARFAGRALEAFTGTDGTFSIDDVPPVEGVRVRATLADAEAIPSGVLNIKVAANPPVRLTLAPSVTLTGRVTDVRTGDPIAGARVDVDAVGDPASRGRGNATTGADGRYEIVHRIAGRWRLVANRRRDYLPGEAKEVELTATVSPFTADLVLDPGLPIAGVTLDATGAALAGVKLALTGTEDGAPAGQTVTRNGGSDGNGAFRWTALRTGRYTLVLSRKGFANLSVALRGGEDRLRLMMSAVPAKN